MPYAPGVTYRGGEFIAEGMNRGKQALAQYLTGFLADRREAEGLDTAIGGLAAQHGDDPAFVEKFGPQLEKVGQMSLAQKRALAGTLAGYAGVQWRDAQMKNFAEDNKRAGRQSELAEQEADRRRATAEALQSFARDFAAGPTPGVWSPEVLKEAATDSGRTRWALGRNPRAMTPELAETLVRSAGADSPGRRAAAAPWEPSAKSLTLPDGTVVQGIMEGPNQFRPIIKPQPVSAQAETIIDPEGRVLGNAIRDKNGALKMVKPKSEPMVTAPLDPADTLGTGPKVRMPLSEWEARRAATNQTGTVRQPTMPVLPNRPWADARRADDEAPAAPPAGDVAEAIREAYRAGQMSREEAVQRLKSLGFQ